MLYRRRIVAVLKSIYDFLELIIDVPLTDGSALIFIANNSKARMKAIGKNGQP